MTHRVFYTREIPFPLEQTWPMFDFAAPGWTVTGGAREVGATRSTEMPGLGRVVDRLVAYREGPDEMSLTYALINDDNPFGSRGYEATVTVMRNTTDPGRCFLRYESRWDTAAPELAERFPGIMDGMVAQMLDALSGDA